MSTYYKIFITFLIAHLFASVGVFTPALAAHPSYGYEPNSLRQTYGLPGHGLPASWTINDLVFLEDYPAAASLTSPEIYMITGSQGSSFGRDLEPWYIVVQRHATNYYTKYGTMPDQLTPEVLAEIYDTDVSSLDPELLDEIKSPLTGQFPRLNATQQSPGDLYIRPLTSDEMMFIGNQSQWNYDIWINHQSRDVETGEVEYIDLLGVFYTRVYGLNDVILVDLATMTR